MVICRIENIGMEIRKLISFGLICFLLASCNSSKKVVYFQDVDKEEKQTVEQSYEIVIQKKDILSIMVNSKDPELVVPFNMPLVSYQLGPDGAQNYTQRILGYTVDSEGNIDFPVLGKIKAEGLSREELTKVIKERLISEGLVKDAVVTIQFQNFKVSVLGEVSRPGSFSITGERVTLLDALSMAGDLTIYGRRDRVAVVREKDGERNIAYLDLRSSDIMTSPYFYLQQNDVVYVQPNKAKIGQSEINQNNSVNVWLSATSVLASIASLLVTIFVLR